MDRFDLNFFSTVAQVSITIIGFSLILPLIKSLTLEIGLIKRGVFIRKNFAIGVLPLIVVVVPLLSSLMISMDVSFVMSCSPLLRYSIYGIHGIFLVTYYYAITERYIVPLPNNVGVIFCSLKLLAELFLVLYPGLVIFFFLIEKFSMGTSLLFFKISSLFLVLVGLLMVTRTLVISPTIGIKYTSRDLDDEWSSMVEKFLSKIESTIDERKNEIKKLREIIKNPSIKKNQRDKINRIIAESEAEIIGIQKKIRDPIRERFKSLKVKKYFILNELLGVENRRQDGEKNIDNFEIGTMRLQRKIQMIQNILKGEAGNKNGKQQNL
jgi:hypothetical protein